MLKDIKANIRESNGKNVLKNKMNETENSLKMCVGVLEIYCIWQKL